MILMPDSYGSLKNSLSVSSKSSARVQKQRYAPVRSPNAFSFSRSSPWRAAPTWTPRRPSPHQASSFCWQ